MRRTFHTTQRNDSNRQRWTIAAMGLFLILIMFVSIFGYYAGSGASGQSVRENGLTFEPRQSSEGGVVWVSTINGVERHFQVLPSAAESVPVSGNISFLSGVRTLGITANVSDDNIAVAQYFYTQLMVDMDPQQSGVLVFQGATTNNTYGLQQFTCASSLNDTIVQLDYDSSVNGSSIYVDGRCIRIVGPGSFDSIAAIERVRYAYFGVI